VHQKLSDKKEDATYSAGTETTQRKHPIYISRIKLEMPDRCITYTILIQIVNLDTLLCNLLDCDFFYICYKFIYLNSWKQ